MPLLRRLLGDILRRHRVNQGRTLRDVSAAARVSLGYLSEVERGQKEASSELLSSISTALGVPMADLFREVSEEMQSADQIAEKVTQFPGRSTSVQRVPPVRDTVPASLAALAPRGSDQPRATVGVSAAA